MNSPQTQLFYCNPWVGAIVGKVLLLSMSELSKSPLTCTYCTDTMAVDVSKDKGNFCTSFVLPDQWFSGKCTNHGDTWDLKGWVQ